MRTLDLQVSHSIRDRIVYETNHKFRFQQYLSERKLAASRLRSPVTAGNRTLRSLTAVGGYFFALNRVAPGANAASSRRRVIRADNHGGWININRAASKAIGLFLANSVATVNHIRVRIKGFDWLSVSRRIHQKLRAIPILEFFEANASRVGLLLQPAQTLLEGL